MSSRISGETKSKGRVARAVTRMFASAESAPYYSGVANRIASADGNWLVQLQNDGGLELRYRGSHVAWIYQP